ncbi:MAG: TrmH family RNA methyltransferase [Bacillota bacterium]|mgnify:FL=1|jgi:tRNA G18 (ribose-2'-O)-methylase SpoU|nr:TrmH family RNA methyltransferase [Bacillota bacterium]NLU54163.1 RNA methyltransferase [Bacillota bacterium]HOA90402.1 TrmH family RNA methyltransferase [Bacillota bacterium]HOJ46526.1 TrmH family RNA methyltransferase [Bacillota bacterium]HPT60566.1 TrmH family RNA methyltransferase [Bacillota bacterium]
MKTQRVIKRDATYQKFEVLKSNRNKRHRYGEFFVEGVRNINHLISEGWTVNSFLYSGEAKLSDWARDILKAVPTKVNYELTDELMAELSGKTDASELMAIVQMRPNDPAQIRPGKNPLLVLFDRPSNRGNLGTIIRSIDAFGLDGLVVTGHSVDLYDPETIVASMGSFFKVPSVRIEDNQSIREWIQGLKAKHPGFQVVGTSAHAECSLFDADLTAPTLLLIGNETDGLSRKLAEISDRMVKIPMSSSSSASSLNVACAASILFYEAIRQRKGTL